VLDGVININGLPRFTMAAYDANDIVSNNICETGTWEVTDISTFGPAGRAMDIGGNIGFYSFMLAQAGWNVSTFEPLPSNIALIHASMCLNPELAKRIDLHEVGLGANPSRCEFISGVDNLGDGMVRCGEDIKQPVPTGYEARGKFEIRRLDDILDEENAGPVDFLKIDVEGFECQVFQGAQSLLTTRRPKVIQTEVWPHMQDCDAQDFLDSFLKADYVVTKDQECTIQNAAAPQGIENYWICDKVDEKNPTMANTRIIPAEGTRHVVTLRSKPA